MPVSHDTLRSVPEPEIHTPRVLGVDDWAKRKGRSYGTILVHNKQLICFLIGLLSHWQIG